MIKRALFALIFMYFASFGCGTLSDTLSITRIDPSAGSTEGGTEVEISGRNFRSGMTVTFAFSSFDQHVCRLFTTTNISQIVPY